MTTTEPQTDAPSDRAPRRYALSADAAAARLDVDPGDGLTSDEAERRLATYGPNKVATAMINATTAAAAPASTPRLR